MAAESSIHVQVARISIESHLTGRSAYPPASAELKVKAACFVSLHLPDGSLRGCIGTLEPRYASLFEEIKANARQAAFSDPRFHPLRADELDGLHLSVDVLHHPEAVSSASQLDPLVYGVIVESGYRRAVLLPNLEGIDTVEEQLRIVRRKGGIGAGEPVKLQRFKVDRYY